MGQRTYNPERVSWRGKSYKKGGKRILNLRLRVLRREFEKEVRRPEHLET